MPTLASSNRAALSYIAETTFGTVPGAGTATALRFTGESFSFDLTKATSNEIRSDRQNTGAVTVDASASGAFNCELSYKEYDPFIAAALMNTFTVYGTAGVGTTFTADFTATTITAAVAPTGSSALTGLVKGQWFSLTTGGANNGKFFRVSTVTAPTSTVITLDVSTPAVVASAVPTCSVRASRLTNGTTQTSFTLEKSFNDVTQFLTYRGMTTSKLNWKFASGALSTGSFDFMGKDMVRNVVTQMPSAPTASQIYDVQNGVRGIGQIWEGGAPVSSTYVKSLDLTVDNNLRTQTALANLGAVGIGVGDCKVTGSFEAYFADGSMYDKFLADTYTSITIGSQDTAGNGYVVTLPHLQLMTGKIMAGGKNQDVMAQFTYEAFADLANATAGLQKVLFVDRMGV